MDCFYYFSRDEYLNEFSRTKSRIPNSDDVFTGTGYVLYSGIFFKK